MQKIYFELGMTFFCFLLLGYGLSLMEKSKSGVGSKELAEHNRRRGTKYIVISVLSLLGVLWITFLR